MARHTVLCDEANPSMASRIRRAKRKEGGGQEEPRRKRKRDDLMSPGAGVEGSGKEEHDEVRAKPKSHDHDPSSATEKAPQPGSLPHASQATPPFRAQTATQAAPPQPTKSSLFGMPDFTAHSPIPGLEDVVVPTAQAALPGPAQLPDSSVIGAPPQSSPSPSAQHAEGPETKRQRLNLASVNAAAENPTGHQGLDPAEVLGPDAVKAEPDHPPAAQDLGKVSNGHARNGEHDEEKQADKAEGRAYKPHYPDLRRKRVDGEQGWYCLVQMKGSLNSMVSLDCTNLSIRTYFLSSFVIIGRQLCCPACLKAGLVFFAYSSLTSAPAIQDDSSLSMCTEDVSMLGNSSDHFTDAAARMQSMRCTLCAFIDVQNLGMGAMNQSACARPLAINQLLELFWCLTCCSSC